MQQAEHDIAAGLRVRYAVHTAAELFEVPVGDVALLALQKLIACERARAEQQAMDQADSEIDDKSAPNPYAHRVRKGTP